MRGLGLPPRQAAFVREYMADLNATNAAIRAGYSAKAATQVASRLLTKAKVSNCIAEAVRRRAERVELRADDILRELLRLARADIGQAFGEDGKLKPIREMPEDVRRAISGLEAEELWEGHGEDRAHVGTLRKVRFWDKTKALDMLGKHLRLFDDLQLTSIPDEQLEAELERRIDIRQRLAPGAAPPAPEPH